MKYLYFSTRDNISIYVQINSRTFQVVRVKDLFGNFELNGSGIVSDIVSVETDQSRNQYLHFSNRKNFQIKQL